MKISMGQMAMQNDMASNLKKSLEFCDSAAGSDLLFFPEIQLTPFFPQYEKLNAAKYCLEESSPEIKTFCEMAKRHHYFLSPNIYLRQGEECYDTSLWINPEGELFGTAEMVHIAQAKQFYEQDYYVPSKRGFQVYDTPFGKVGIVICYDRHLPESIRTCVLKGAELIIIPTANTKAEPMEMFEWEIRVQAMQNQVFIAMCNRVGREGEMDFAGESLVVHPSGDVIMKADDTEQLITCEIDLCEASALRNKIPYLRTRRPEFYL